LNRSDSVRLSFPRLVRSCARIPSDRLVITFSIGAVSRWGSEYFLLTIGAKGIWFNIRLEDDMALKANGVNGKSILDIELCEDGSQCARYLNIA
jgi:hypothetical protein